MGAGSADVPPDEPIAGHEAVVREAAEAALVVETAVAPWVEAVMAGESRNVSRSRRRPCPKFCLQGVSRIWRPTLNSPRTKRPWTSGVKGQQKPSGKATPERRIRLRRWAHPPNRRRRRAPTGERSSHSSAARGHVPSSSGLRPESGLVRVSCGRRPRTPRRNRFTPSTTEKRVRAWNTFPRFVRKRRRRRRRCRTSSAST